MVQRYSGGIPRVINLLCEHALITAFAEGQKPIAPSLVESVAREFDSGLTENTTAPASREQNENGNSHGVASLEDLGTLMDRLRRP